MMEVILKREESGLRALYYNTNREQHSFCLSENEFKNLTTELDKILMKHIREGLKAI